MEPLSVAIGLGLVVSIVFTEIFGLAAGGMVVPGYVAMHLHRPAVLITTLVAAIATWAVVHALSTVLIVYGRRRTALMILIGYLFGAAFGLATHAIVPQTGTAAMSVTSGPGLELTVIGYIIPGLIAIWVDRQGLVETISTLLTASVVVRLVMILIFGGGALS